jgi:hypothetical protein
VVAAETRRRLAARKFITDFCQIYGSQSENRTGNEKVGPTWRIQDVFNELIRGEWHKECGFGCFLRFIFSISADLTGATIRRKLGNRLEAECKQN